jgi:hypothetical protein
MAEPVVRFNEETQQYERATAFEPITKEAEEAKLEAAKNNLSNAEVRLKDAMAEVEMYKEEVAFQGRLVAAFNTPVGVREPVDEQAAADEAAPALDGPGAVGALDASEDTLAEGDATPDEDDEEVVASEEVTVPVRRTTSRAGF